MGSSLLKSKSIPTQSIEHTKTPLSLSDLNDLCDATDSSIEDGGGFGWTDLPDRDTLETYWQGVVAMPSRLLFLARQEGIICGSAQLLFAPKNNQAQGFTAKLMSLFIAPWARQEGLASTLLTYIERTARDEGIEVLNLDIRATQHSALKLYENAGYIKIGEHPYYARVNGETIKGLYYYKKLKPQNSDL